MAGAFFFICMFVITVCGLLLFRPIQVNSITEYSQPAAIEERKNVTKKMAEFLDKNPKMMEKVKPSTLGFYAPSSNEPTPSVEIPQDKPLITHQVSVAFQGTTLQFASIAEFDQWIYKNATDDPNNFLRQLQENDNPELYLDTLKKVSEINQRDDVTEQVKVSFLEEARNLIKNKDGYHQQMMQKALQSYLDLEKDKALGKKNADEILKAQ